MLHTKSSFDTKTKKVTMPDSKKHNLYTMNSSNLNLGIKRLPYSRMLKSEVADYAENTIGIFEKHDTESALITPVLDLMRAKEPAIKLLRLSYGIDTERLKANKLKADMLLQISAFKLSVRKLNRSNLALDLHVVQNAINSHLTYLNKCRNDKELNQKVGGFFDLMITDVELQTAITDFDLQDDVNLMTNAYAEVNNVWQKRVELLSQRSSIATSVIIKGIAETINNLFKGVEVAHLISIVAVAGTDEEPTETVDLTPLIDELNQLSDMYYRSISIRDANNKRKAEKDKEMAGDDANGTTNGDTTTTQVQTTTMKSTNLDSGSADELPADTDEDSIAIG